MKVVYVLAKPTKEQLAKINKLASTELTEEQVFVFRSLSADTLPVSRHSWAGEYFIHMNRDMLTDLKRDYQTGVGLLASHDSRRLPFGRTFDAVIETDRVDGQDVDTLYVDQYIVKYVQDGDTKVPLRTEINGMTTEDIANHVSVGHMFDTSIGFVMTDCKCSICKNDIRDYEQCKHYPGYSYEVMVGDRAEKVRCDILACGGEGLENSIVYAGAVNRAIIQNANDKNDYTANGVQPDVKDDGSQFYNVDDIKKIPLGSEIYCRFSKGAGGMQMFTSTPERQNVEGAEEMTVENKQPETTEYTAATSIQPMGTMYSKEDYDAIAKEKENFETKYNESQTELGKVKDELNKAKEVIEGLSAKAEIAEEYRKDLIQETLSASVKARGNSFNSERYGKYLETLSDSEIKEELSALKDEFKESLGDNRVTETELEDKQDDKVTLSEEEIRQQASINALEIYRSQGGDLIELTKSELKRLKSEQN